MRLDSDLECVIIGPHSLGCRVVSLFNIPMNTHIVACVRLLWATSLAFHYKNSESTQNSL